MCIATVKIHVDRLQDKAVITLWVIQSKDDMLTHFRHAAAGGEEGEEEEEW